MSKQNKQEQWEKSTEYMLAKANINMLMGNIIDTCFSRWNQKEMLISQKIEDLVSGYVLDEMMKIYNANKFYKNLISQTRQEAVEEERKRIKGAFIEHFAGAGEIFFPYVGVGDTDLDDEITAAHQEWNEIIKSLSQEKK